jgi:hypothetical protein
MKGKKVSEGSHFLLREVRVRKAKKEYIREGSLSMKNRERGLEEKVSKQGTLTICAVQRDSLEHRMKVNR